MFFPASSIAWRKNQEFGTLPKFAGINAGVSVSIFV
jgi:hypothetical protein